MHVLQWFQETFPQAEHILDTSAALPATTNLYLSYCLLEHMPQDLDLVFVELGKSLQHPLSSRADT